MGLIELFSQYNIWITLVFLIIWIIDAIFIIRLDLGMLRGWDLSKLTRSGYKEKVVMKKRREKFVSIWMIGLKYSILGSILTVTTIILSISSAFTFGAGSFIYVFLTFFIMDCLLIAPAKLMNRYLGSEFGLRWLIKLIDKHDENSKNKNIVAIKPVT